MTPVGRPEAPERLPYPVIDNHCHLDMGIGDDVLPLDEALAASAAVGVPRIVQVGCDVVSSQWAAATAERYDAVVAAVALHPNEAPRVDLDAAMAEIERLAHLPQVRAIGETGLDYFRTGDEGRDQQQDSFRRHIDLAKRTGKTLVVHDRDAHDDVLGVLDAEGAPERVVMHCFSGDADFARACAERGFWLSFAGTVTFKNAQYLRDALAVAPRDKILAETDAPFLTPMPHRGKPNGSYLLPHTVRLMSEVRGEDLTAFCEVIEANTFEAFGGFWG